jgi:uncharacterized protein YciI
MKKFVLLAHGTMDHTPAFQQAHRAWWTSMQGHVIDSGNPLVNGRNVAKDGEVTEIAEPDTPALGYSIIEAETLEDALALLGGCPMDMWVYEAVAM